MKVIYRGCEITVTREKCLGGWDEIFFSVFSDDGYEITSGYSDSADTIRDWVKDLKDVVDAYAVNPEAYIAEQEGGLDNDR